MSIPYSPKTHQGISSQALATKSNKKFELMLTRRAKAYSSSYSQTVSLSPTISLQFIHGVCAAAKDRKYQ